MGTTVYVGTHIPHMNKIESMKEMEDSWDMQQLKEKRKQEDIIFEKKYPYDCFAVTINQSCTSVPLCILWNIWPEQCIIEVYRSLMQCSNLSHWCWLSHV